MDEEVEEKIPTNFYELGIIIVSEIFFFLNLSIFIFGYQFVFSSFFTLIFPQHIQDVTQGDSLVYLITFTICVPVFK
jgi:hypothetical protein